MNPLTKEQFAAIWQVMLDNFRQSRDAFTLGFIYQTLMDRDPGLTSDQFGYAVQQCLISCKFMPSLNEVLRQIYEPDLTGMPVMPDIDPKYADEYQLNHYNTALNTVNKWVSQNDHKPAVGHFRKDRINEIPGIPDRMLNAAKNGILSSFRRDDDDFLNLRGTSQKVLSQQESALDFERKKRDQIQRLRNAG